MCAACGSYGGLGSERERERGRASKKRNGMGRSSPLRLAAAREDVREGGREQGRRGRGLTGGCRRERQMEGANDATDDVHARMKTVAVQKTEIGRTGGRERAGKRGARKDRDRKTRGPRSIIADSDSK